MTNKIEIHEEIIMEMHDLYIAKDSDYGESFTQTRKEYPQAIMIRLTDKLNRLKVLTSGTEQKVLDESIDDTLTDLANYAVMEKVERKVDKLYYESFLTRQVCSVDSEETITTNEE